MERDFKRSYCCIIVQLIASRNSNGPSLRAYCPNLFTYCELHCLKVDHAIITG